jgi:propionate catabolism operon transcriptional regulator
VVIQVLPLRERPEDILPLARFFAQRIAGPGTGLSRSLALALLRYDWPENVRELNAVIEQAVVQSGGPGPLLLSESLAARLTPAGRAGLAGEAAAQRPTAEQLQAQLLALNGNVKALADALGVARTTLYRWLRAAGIDPKSLRE